MYFYINQKIRIEMTTMFITSPSAKLFPSNSWEKCLKPINKKPKITLKMNLEKLKEFDDSELDPETKKLREKKAEIERLRAAEKFMQIDEGKFECQACGYVLSVTKVSI